MKAESGLIWDGNEDISNLELGWQSESGPYFWRTLPFRLWQAFFGGNHTHAWNGNCRCTYIGIGDSSTMVASSHSRQQQKKHALMIEPAQHVNQTTVYPVFCLLLFHHKTGHQLHHYEYTVWLFSIVHMVCLQTLHMLHHVTTMILRPLDFPLPPPRSQCDPASFKALSACHGANLAANHLETGRVLWGHEPRGFLSDAPSDYQRWQLKFHHL